MSIRLGVLVEDKEDYFSATTGSVTPERGICWDLNEGVSVKLNNVVSIKGMHDVLASYIVDFSVNFGNGIAVGVIANSIYSKLVNNKAEKIVINGKRLDVDLGALEEAIKEEIKKQANN